MSKVLLECDTAAPGAPAPRRRWSAGRLRRIPLRHWNARMAIRILMPTQPLLLTCAAPLVARPAPQRAVETPAAPGRVTVRDVGFEVQSGRLTRATPWPQPLTFERSSARAACRHEQSRPNGCSPGLHARHPPSIRRPRSAWRRVRARSGGEACAGKQETRCKGMIRASSRCTDFPPPWHNLGHLAWLAVLCARREAPTAWSSALAN